MLFAALRNFFLFSNLFEAESTVKGEREQDVDIKRVKTISENSSPSTASARTDSRSLCNSSDSSEKFAIEHQLKEIADVKVENLRLMEELKEMKLAHEKERKWLDEQMKAAKLEQQKSEFLHTKDKIIFKAIRDNLEQGREDLSTELEHLTLELNRRMDDFNVTKSINADEKSLVQELLVKLEDSHKVNQSSTELILKQNESLNRLNKENLQLKRKNHRLAANNDLWAESVDHVESGIMKKIRRMGDDFAEKFSALKKKVEKKKVEVRVNGVQFCWSAQNVEKFVFHFRLNRLLTTTVQASFSCQVESKQTINSD